MATPNKYEIIVHGTSGRWSAVRECRKRWSDNTALTMDEAIKVCQSIKNDGYGVCLFENGKLVLPAPF
jgi:hypothetical protein